MPVELRDDKGRVGYLHCLPRLGYWRAWWSDMRWIQWPIGCEPGSHHAFGEVTDLMIERARHAAASVASPSIYETFYKETP